VATRSSSRRPRVVIFYKSIAQYRRPFYDLLRTRLADDGIALEVIYGAPVPYEVARRDRIDLSWAHKTHVRVVHLAGRELYWQPGLARVRRGDLVIVEQASKLLVNYILFALHLTGFIRLGMWGHGRTVRARRSSALGEALKNAISRRVSWWFAYNERSAAFVRELGFPDDRITRLQNAIDTKALVSAAAAVTPRRLDEARRELGVSGRHICVYVGAMYEDKRIPFLLEACRLVRKLVPDFEMLFVGDGPDGALVRGAAAQDAWMHYLGPRFGDDRVPYMLLAALSLMPGGVGLGVLDSFALGVPLVTTSVPSHGPEIEYLENGVNGLIVEDGSSTQAYADAVAATLQDERLLATLRSGCEWARGRYSVEEMVERFANGVRRALEVTTGAGAE
jgi:glycosyltransferase involved in cell wall biosynthesis